LSAWSWSDWARRHAGDRHLPDPQQSDAAFSSFFTVGPASLAQLSDLRSADFSPTGLAIGRFAAELFSGSAGLSTIEDFVRGWLITGRTGIGQDAMRHQHF
jgi:hypothetical protein